VTAALTSPIRTPRAEPPAEAGAAAPILTALDRALIDHYQRGWPLSPDPWTEVAAALGTTPEHVRERLVVLQSSGIVSRLGAVVRPHAVGASTLAAVAVPPARLEEVATLVNAQPGVNHNYEREHRYNLWFVLTAADAAALDAALARIERRIGLPVLVLPMLDDYHIDLGFPIDWQGAP
jgi:DNA-binding Lrp family transcriptional regulator